MLPSLCRRAFQPRLFNRVLIGDLLCRFAGYLITSFFNILVLIALGNLPSASAQDAEYLENKGKQAAGAHDNDQHHHQPAAEPFSSTAVAVAGPNETVTTVTQGPIYPGEHGAHRV